MSSSTDEGTLLRGSSASHATVPSTPELRSGSWTRLGPSRVLGDAVTEQTMAGLAESTRTAARAQGYSVGWAEGRREAAAAAREEAARAQAVVAADEARREAEHRAGLDALRRAAEQLQASVATVTAWVEDQALTLARELTTELVGHELRHSPDPGGDLVRRALAVLPEGAPVTLRLHPDVLDPASAARLAEVGVRVVPDATLERHDGLLETDQAIVELGVSTALERVRTVLS
jgi:flagellar assembly protein FliH